MYSAVNAAGFTLFELMLSLSLSVLILAAAISFYIQGMRNIVVLTTSQREAVEAETVLSLLRNRIANAGANGCNGVLQPAPALTGDAHRLQVSYQAQPQMRLLSVGADERTLVIEPGVEFRDNQLLMVCDADHAEVVTVRDFNATNIGEVMHLRSPLQYHYQHDALIGPFVFAQFYLEKNNLMMENAGHKRSHLFEGLKALNFTYDNVGGETVGVAVNLTLNHPWFMYTQINSRVV